MTALTSHDSYITAADKPATPPLWSLGGFVVSRRRRLSDRARRAAAFNAKLVLSGRMATEPATLRSCDSCHGPTTLDSLGLWCARCHRFT